MNSQGQQRRLQIISKVGRPAPPKARKSRSPAQRLLKMLQLELERERKENELRGLDARVLVLQDRLQIIDAELSLLARAAYQRED